MANSPPPEGASRRSVHQRTRPSSPSVGTGTHRDVREVYGDAARFLNSRGSGVLDLRTDEPFREPGALLESDPPEHDGVRAVMREVVAPRNVRRLPARFEEVAETIVDRLLELGTFDAYTEMAAGSLSRSSRTW